MACICKQVTLHNTNNIRKTLLKKPHRSDNLLAPNLAVYTIASVIDYIFFLGHGIVHQGALSYLSQARVFGEVEAQSALHK